MNHRPARQWLIDHVYQFEQARQPDDEAHNPASALVVDLMRASKLIWRGGQISPEVYAEAHSRTWKWFVAQLVSTYEPARASFTTWFNNRLKHEISTVLKERLEEEKRRFRPSDSDEDYEWIFPPAPSPNQWMNTVEEWLDLVKSSQDLQHKRMQEYPDVNCQNLLIAILTELKNSRDFTWDALPGKDKITDVISPKSLERFCKKRCFSCFKDLLSD